MLLGEPDEDENTRPLTLTLSHLRAREIEI